MTINHAILGILHYQPMTGYDLKKRIQDSTYMHWSGNNNQIYKALVELLDADFVTNEVQYQEKLPSKKIYTITQKGIAMLKVWTAAAPEPMEYKKMFLIQLAWADLLDGTELLDLLSKYEEEIRLQLMMNREKIRRGSGFVPRTQREAFLWKSIDENTLSSYQNELDWVCEVKSRLLAHEAGAENEFLRGE